MPQGQYYLYNPTRYQTSDTRDERNFYYGNKLIIPSASIFCGNFNIITKCHAIT